MISVDEKNYDGEVKMHDTKDVEKIIGVRHRGGRTKYRLKLKKDNGNTWVPSEIIDRPRLVEKFGMENNAKEKKDTKAVKKRGKTTLQRRHSEKNSHRICLS